MPDRTAAREALHSVFDRIYVINLPERSDRRAELERQFRHVDLSLQDQFVTVFPAVRPDTPGNFPEVGIRGCFESHLGILEQAVGSGARHVLIMEDDADFSADFGERFPLMAAKLQEREWDVFFGHRNETYHAKAPQGDATLDDIAPDDGIRLTHFIALSQRAARLAVPYLRGVASRPHDHPDGGAMHVDAAYNWFRRTHPELVTLAPHYPVAVQRPSRSDIHRGKWFDRIEPLRPVVSALRRLKSALR
ncbi:Glycosyltransferase family 25 (LPS biosynthesis protein) [Salinihabitans flavidus]|uniref:Glycosyltransferase family 25 (LPS biosynthesis protein) n=1 Tax=Salinihabitans flavidus TaxID=569882 RepID=A0A1H8VKA0_9RHOB|nr:glycosyltransferase family 25 protein [Salinihabitans flavidus]SEP15338.1 Glycosyltransferase family 25 (LPS biosynthesis protein) [Salinihabitans flavidus]